MKHLVFSLSLLALASCDVAQSVADDVTRERARKAVNETMAQKAPGVNLAPITDCVIDNSSAQELLSLAKMSVTGVDQSTADLIFKISSRTETVTCIAQSGIAGLL